MDPYLPTPRTTPTRYRERVSYDRDLVHGILDEALICHLGYLSGGRPVVLPTAHARLDETLYLHFSSGGGPMLAARATPAGLDVCVTASLLDGLVLARAAMHHSVNFRSVVIMGVARPVDDPAEKKRVLARLLDHIAAGRSTDCRPPDARELAATGVLALDLVEVSAKVRSGGPVDDPPDHALPYWAGEVPLRLTAGAPVPAADLARAIATPRYLT